MSDTKYKIQKLKGAKNLHRWKEEIKSVFIIENYQNIVSRDEPRPIAPSLPSNTDVAVQKQYKTNVVQYSKDLKVWKNTNNYSIAYLILLIEEGPKQQTKGIEYIAEVYAKLVRLYGKTNLTTRDEVLHVLARADSSEYVSIQEYLEFLKQHLKTLEDIDHTLPKWIEGTFFRLGLPEDLALYIFQLVQTTRANKTELDIDDITIVLSEYEKRVSNSKENAKVIATRFRKQDKPKDQGGQGGQDYSRSKSRNNKNKKKKCNHYEGIYKKSKCWYLQKDLRPKGQEPNRDKKYLTIKNINKKKVSNPNPSSKTSENNTGSGSSAKSNKATIQQIRSFTTKTKSLLAKVVNTTTPIKGKTSVVYIDTTSNVHTFQDRSKFTTYTKISSRNGNNTLKGIDGLGLYIPRTETVTLLTMIDSEPAEVEITEVYYVPDMKYNLLSIGILEQKGYYVTIRDDVFKVIDTLDKVVLSGTRYSKDYILDLKYSEPLRALRSSTTPPANHASQDTWYRRFGRLNIQDVKRVANISKGIDMDEANRLQKKEPPHNLYIDYLIGKKTKTPSRVPRRGDPQKKATIKGQLMHLDLAGDSKIKRTKGSYKWLVSIIDDATDIVFTFTLKKKSELPRKLLEFCEWVAIQGNPVQRLSSDNESVYTSYKVQDILKDRGIQWEPSALYTPNQNVVAKRSFRTIFKGIRAMLHDSQMPQS